MLREVFHITKKELIPSIEREWLKTLEQQSKEWTINLDLKLSESYIWRAKNDQRLIDFYTSTIYFGLERPPNWPSWVSFLVEESIVDVLNNHMEFQWFWKYMSSKMKLSEFLQRSRDNKFLHPITAQPIPEKEIVSTPPWKKVYSPEVIIQTNCIKQLAKIHTGEF